MSDFIPTCSAQQVSSVGNTDMPESWELFIREPGLQGERCRVCDGIEDFFTHSMTDSEKIRFHARKHPGCLWLQEKKGVEFVLSALREVRVVTPEQILNTSAGREYNGDLTKLLLHYPLRMLSPTNPKTSICKYPMVPFERREGRAPRFCRYSLVDRRKSTFQDYPTRDMCITGDQLALNGFFLTGIRDRIQCFWCAGTLENLGQKGMTADNISQQHIWSYYGCPLMALLYGARYVLDVFRAAPTHIKETARDTFRGWQDDQEGSELVFQPEVVKFIDERLAAEMDPEYLPPLPPTGTATTYCKVQRCQTKMVFAMKCGCLVCDFHRDDDVCQVCNRTRTSADSQMWSIKIHLAKEGLELPSTTAQCNIHLDSSSVYLDISVQV